MRTRSEVFDDFVLDAVERVERRHPGRLGDLEVAVELVPPSDPAPWEHQQVPLSRLFPAERDFPARIVLYRRPIETRASDRESLGDLVHTIVVEQLAGALGVDPQDLDPSYSPDEWSE